MTRNLTILTLVTALLLTVACNSTTPNITVPDAPTSVAAFDAMSLADRQALHAQLPDIYIEPLDGEGYLGRIFHADTHAIYLVDASGERTTVLPETLCPRVLYGIRLTLMPDREMYSRIERMRRDLLAGPPVAGDARQRLADFATDHPAFAPAVTRTLGDPLTPIRHPDVPNAVSEFATRATTIIETHINPDVHLIATDHFLIYTTGPTSQDAALATHCETLYRYLLAGTDLPDHTTIWPEPLAVYCFATPDEYDTFIRVAMPNDSAELLAGSDGFCAGDDGLSYLVLNGADMTDPNFTERLTHETTHAFYRQYLSDVLLPSWLDEGLAEATVADTLPNSHAAARYADITQRLVDGDELPGLDFNRFGGTDDDYAIAHALVRYARSLPDGELWFRAFPYRLKAGADQHTVAQAVFAGTLDDWFDAWQASIQD